MIDVFVETLTSLQRAKFLPFSHILLTIKKEKFINTDC